MPAFTFTMASGCVAGAGFIDILSLTGGATGAVYAYSLTGSAGTVLSGPVSTPDLPLRLDGLLNETFAVTVAYDNPDGGSGYSTRTVTLSCGSAGTGPGALTLENLSSANETAALNDGSLTIRVSGGTAPLTAAIPALSLSHAVTAGADFTFAGLPPGTYTVQVTDADGTTVEAGFTIAAYVAPVTGCTDPYADNFDPEAELAGVCTYTPRWRSAWQFMDVRAPAVTGQTEAFLSGLLRVGFRAGHPLAADRPLGAPLLLRATVGPDGYATFRLGPYLRALLGTPDGLGGYRLDLNSTDALASGLYVGYELRRPGGELLEHGYALNAAVPDEQIRGLLTPFPQRLPVWPGFDDYLVAQLGDTGTGRFALVSNDNAYQFTTTGLPCPPHPLPVAWLAPGGGFGYWVFQGRPQLGDDVGDGQAFTEATTGESRYSQRGEARRTITASSGAFKGADLMEGLRTLWRSPQVWYRPVANGPWVPVKLEPGSFPAGRVGVTRQQVSISFTHAAPEWAQGQ